MSKSGYLDVNNPNQVGSVQKLSVLTGEPNTWLFAYSGLAFIEAREQGGGIFSGGEGQGLTVYIVLDNITGVLLQYAATSSLANISGSGGVSQFDLQSVSLNLRENGDLVLTTVLSSFTDGDDWADLGTYSYYVSAKILLEAASISGTIRWKKTLATPLSAPHFVITADTQLPPLPGQLVGTTIVEATGVEGALDSSDQTYYYIPYTITGPLLGKSVSVAVDPMPSKFSGVQTFGLLDTQQISGPSPISLTTTNLQVTNVNFEMFFEPAPK
ncbi:MAG TPA: hypothetical protein VFN26_03685 [Candidatus Acidoferrum sp.]|nr:hypothetical protein [Candidatus Acidoferrum sp.]